MSIVVDRGEHHKIETDRRLQVAFLIEILMIDT
jgi:hypothetical protein